MVLTLAVLIPAIPGLFVLWLIWYDRREQRRKARARELAEKFQPPARTENKFAYGTFPERAREQARYQAARPVSSSSPSQAPTPSLYDPANPLNPISPISPFNSASYDPGPSSCDSGSSWSSSDSGSSSCDSSSSSSWD